MEDEGRLSQRRTAGGILNSQGSFLFYLYVQINGSLTRTFCSTKDSGHLDKVFLVLLTWLTTLQTQKPNSNREKVSVHQILLIYLAAH